MNIKTSLFFFLSLLLALLCLTGCALALRDEIEDAYLNDEGKLVVTYKDGHTQTLPTSGTTPSYSLTVQSEGGAVAAAATKGLQSAVTVKIDGDVSGAGVVYKLDRASGDAFIITNYHVVYDSYYRRIADGLTVCLYGSEYDALSIPVTYVGGSMYYDIAILRIEDSERVRSSGFLAPATFADSDLVSVGIDAIAVGNPRGYGLSATYGIVSVDSETIRMTAADDRTVVSFRVMRIDTAVNGGNSGGGLYNSKGELIGIVNAKMNSGSVENIAYALPSAVVRAVADNIIDHCYGTDISSVQRCMLNLTYDVVDSYATMNAERGSLEIIEKIAVDTVSDGPMRGKLQSGDVFLSVKVGGRAEKSVTRSFHIVDALLDARVGDTVEITVLRNGEQVTVSFTVEKAHLSSY